MNYKILKYDKNVEKLFKNNEKLKIYSIFENVINLISSDNELYTLGNKEKICMGKNTILIEDGTKFYNLALERNDIAFFNNEGIKINKYLFMYKSGKLWKSPKVEIAFIPNKQIEKKVMLIIKKLSEINKEYNNYINYLNGLECNLLEKYQFLKIDAFMNEQNNICNIKSIIGLGQGLTPCCDDFMLGYILANNIIDKNDKLNYDVLAVAKAQTNFISYTFLKRVIREEYSEDFINLVNETFCYDISLNAVNKIMKFGSTSGVFILTGYCLKIYEWLKGVRYGDNY